MTFNLRLEMVLGCFRTNHVLLVQSWLDAQHSLRSGPRLRCNCMLSAHKRWTRLPSTCRRLRQRAPNCKSALGGCLTQRSHWRFLAGVRNRNLYTVPFFGIFCFFCPFLCVPSIPFHIAATLQEGDWRKLGGARESNEESHR